MKDKLLERTENIEKQIKDWEYFDDLLRQGDVSRIWDANIIRAFLILLNAELDRTIEELKKYE